MPYILINDSMHKLNYECCVFMCGFVRMNPGAQGDQKWLLDLPELELHSSMLPNNIGAGNQILVLFKNSN